MNLQVYLLRLMALYPNYSRPDSADTFVCVGFLSLCDLISLWLSTALPLPDKIHNFYLMVQSGWAFGTTLREIDVSFQVHWGRQLPFGNSLRILVQYWLSIFVRLFLSCSLSFSYRVASLCSVPLQLFQSSHSSTCFPLSFSSWTVSHPHCASLRFVLFMISLINKWTMCWI